jgi:RHS repeat-associated protein
VGNLLVMAHRVSSGGWTQNYTYSEASQIVAAETCNRLSTTSLPGDPAGGPYSGVYTYDAHGNMTRMPHLPALVWDEEDRLRSTTRQRVLTGTPVTTFYVYDAGGQRLRKTTDGQAAAGVTPVRQSERIYLGAVEIYREFAADGVTVTLQRETLHVMDGARRVVVVETRTAGTDSGVAQLTRYQFTNHLDSAVLELDDLSQIISYEEYFPYGSTSYQAVRSQTDTPKRYRYTAKERDFENDLYYHGARYYAPWLGRWTACDPIGIKDGLNVYWYVHANPIMMSDTTGTQCDPSIATCVDSENNSSQSLELQNQRSSEFDREVDKLNDENARFQIAYQSGELKPQKFDAEQWQKDVTQALKRTETPEAKLARQVNAAVQERKAQEAAEQKAEAELNKELPSLGGSLIPVYGSGKSSLVHFQHGNYGRGIAYGALAVTDVFLVKSLIVGGGKLVVRGGAAILASEAEKAVPAAAARGLETAATDAGGAAASRAPAIIDTSVLINAQRGNQSALSALRATDPRITLSQLREFLDVNSEVQQTQLAQFLLQEGVTPLTTSYGQLATRELRDTFWRIARQGAIGDTTGDAAMVIHGIQSGLPIVTGDIRLINTVQQTLRVPGVTFVGVRF